VLSYPRAPGRPPRMPMSGSAGAMSEALGAFQEIGVEHVVFEISTQSPHGTLATMEVRSRSNRSLPERGPALCLPGTRGRSQQ
jgi:hypothetical protein